MNAGAMGGWIFDIVDEMRMMSMDGSIGDLVPVNAEHRLPVLRRTLRSAVALGAVLRPTSKSDVSGPLDDRSMTTDASGTSPSRVSPARAASSRSPPGGSAGRLIEESGLKGAKVGGAEVSRVHANFVINSGDTRRALMCWSLYGGSRAAVWQAKGVDLEPEVLLYGENGGMSFDRAGDRRFCRGHVSGERGIHWIPGAACALFLTRSFPTRLFPIVADALPEGYDPARHIVFSTLHGTFGEDGGMQGLLDGVGGVYPPDVTRLAARCDDG